MIHVIIFIFLGLIYFSLPFLLQLIITVINTWLIDPIPIMYPMNNPTVLHFL